MIKTRTQNAFTLIELIIVIGLLGALAAIMLPTLKVNRVETLEQIVPSDMNEIRRAFQRLYRDCVLNKPKDLENVRKYGLYPLMERPDEFDDGTVEKWTIDRYDAAKDKGWRGPYLEREGYRDIDPDPAPEDIPPYGQPSGGVHVPVIEDPFNSADDDAQYYRVIAPKNAAGDYIYSEMSLVYVGADGVLGNDDDIAIRLCPYVEYK